MKLKDVATVIAGHTFRRAIEPDQNGDLFVLQAKDVVKDELFSSGKGLSRISGNLVQGATRLTRNDVVLVSRGMKSGAFRAAVFEGDDINVVASSSVHIIRVIDKKISPKFISIFLNSKDGQTALANIITGSYIGALPRRKLEKINIPNLSREKQQLLVDLFGNIRDQQKMLEREKELKEKIINGTFRKLITA